jgi:hypothetical protein
LSSHDRGRIERYDSSKDIRNKSSLTRSIFGTILRAYSALL